MTDLPTPVTAPVPLRRGPRTAAVVVTRGVTRYLPTTLDALAGQTRAPSLVLVVDAASSETVPAGGGGAAVETVDTVVHRAFAGTDTDVRVLRVPGARTFGDAVRAALAGGAGPGVEWLWLLHDDCAPEATALAELVRVVEHAPSVGVAGVKQLDWEDPTRLLEVGVTTSRLGRRFTGVDQGEVDQGQHDGREDVLAVGLAGALVRRDVWDELDGPDPALGPFGDGLDLCRRARLAGHRVVVAPRAVVRHAQASYAGLRDDDLLHVLTGTSVHDAHPHGDPVPSAAAPRTDPRRSFATRRRAHVHARLAAVPLPVVPLLTVVFLAAALVRSLYRVASKDAVLATAELAAPVVAVLNPARMAHSRASARRTRRLPRRSLRPLQASWREIFREERDRLLARREARRVRQAPSELELAELAALATRRRVGLALLLVALLGLTVAAVGELLVAAVTGAALVGGGLLPARADLGGLWHVVTSGWVAAGLGVPAPPDPLLTVLVPFAALTGGTTQGAVHLLFLGGLVLAGTGAWAAAGAATRAVGLRWWAALVWVAAPALHAALDEGRLGAVMAHAALPWAALGVARALGVQRRDVVVSGMVGAGVVPVARGATAMVVPDPADAPPTPPGTPAAEDVPGRPGSVTAAAAAGLALAVAVAGAPVLLPAGLLALVAVAVAARAGRRRLVLVALPPIVLAGPLVQEAVTRWQDGGWRVLVAEPGLPVGSTAAPAWQQLLGQPTRLATDLATIGGAGATVAAIVLGLTLVVLALLALGRGRAVARGARAGWLVAACGLGAAVVAGRVETAVAGGVAVRGWPGPGVSLTVLGLLTAAVLGADGMRARVAQGAAGWRRFTALALVGVAVLMPLVPLGVWLTGGASGSPGGRDPVVSALDGPVVPAVGQQAQSSEARSRVLALAPAGDAGIAYAVLRGDGPQLTEWSAAARARELHVRAGEQSPDAATAAVERLVARLASGAVGDVSGDVAELAVGAVLVPPTTREVDEASRVELVGRLDATAGLERITESDTGVIWRVVAPAATPAEDGSGGPGGSSAEADPLVTSWARLVDPAPGQAVTALPADDLSLRTVIPPGEEGRTLVLAERPDPGWTAELDGRRLPATDDGWQQAFAVGERGGVLTVSYDPDDRRAWSVVQAVVLGLVGLLALPLRRRRGGTR